MLESRKRTFYCCGEIETGWLARVTDLFRTGGLNIRRIDMSCPLKEGSVSWLLIEYELPQDQEVLPSGFETSLAQLVGEHRVELLRS